jgi:hypothetical protein
MNEKCASIYDAFKVMGSIWSRYLDAASGLILQTAVIDAKDWPQIACIVKRAAKIDDDLETVILPRCVRRSVTPLDILDELVANVISGRYESDDQYLEWRQALVRATARGFNVSEENAEGTDLMEANDAQLDTIDRAFASCVGENYAAAVIVDERKREPSLIRLQDLLEVLYAYVLQSADEF